MSHYLVTSNARGEGGLYHLDAGRGRIRRLLRGSYRGLTRGPDGCWYFVSGYRNPKKDLSTVHRLDPKSWQSEPVASFPVRDSHDLKWIGGCFYLVASVGNQILRLDASCREVDRLRIVEDPRDICHVNCVLELDGDLYCTIFTLTPGPREEKRKTGAWHTEGKLLKLDWERKGYTVVCEPLAQPHSLVPRGEGLYLVESHSSSVTRLDYDLKGRERVWQYRGFLRGLAFGPGEIVLGVCRYYSRDRQRLRPLPWIQQWLEQRFPFSGLLVLDHSWRLRRRVSLPGAEPYDVVLLQEGEEVPS